MKIAILIDNNPHPEFDYFTEHGLSVYFEVDGLKWLFDVGASEQFYTNAVNMGIHIEDIDYLILSHGHQDHTGGLEKFIKVNRKAKIILSSEIKGKAFYSYRHQSKKNISIDYLIVDQNTNRFVFADKNMTLIKNVNLICEIPKIHKTPKANKTLTLSDSEGENPDTFNHELALAVNTPKGIVVFSGCAHNGVLNLLEACSDSYNQSQIAMCIGGTHLIDSDSNNMYETESDIKKIGKSIVKHYPDLKLITGHCTGKNALIHLSTILGDNCKSFHTGTIITL